jgi:hypothetical protein
VGLSEMFEFLQFVNGLGVAVASVGRGNGELVLDERRGAGHWAGLKARPSIRQFYLLAGRLRRMRRRDGPERAERALRVG